MDDDVEADAGVLAVTWRTRLIVRKQGPDIATGTYRIDWDNPSDEKTLEMRRVGAGWGSPWLDEPFEETYTDSDVEYRIRLRPWWGLTWDDTDTVDVTLTHVESGCSDTVKLVPVKVDLDVDADYDGSISVDSPDDAIEESAGGIVAVGKRTEIKLREVLPSGTASSATLSWTTDKIKVFDAASEGNEISNGESIALPKTLWVQGESANSDSRDVTVTLEIASGAKDEVVFTVFDVDKITVTPKGTPADYDLPDPVKIAAGAIESDAHQADVVIEVLPALGGFPVEVSVAGGLGHGAGKDAKLVLNSVTLVGGGAGATVETANGGTIDGVLTSSDVFGGCSINAGTKQTDVTFNWDEFDDEEPYVDVDGNGRYTAGETFTDADGDGSYTHSEWRSDPPYLITPGTSTETLRLRHHRGMGNDANWQPLDGHSIRFYVEEVQHLDTNGATVILVNTADDPSDLSAWASFPDTPVTTDQNGEVSVTLTMQDKPEMVSLTMVAYDFSVWDEPAMVASATIVATTQTENADEDRKAHENAQKTAGDADVTVTFSEHDKDTDNYGWDGYTMSSSASIDWPYKSVAVDGSDAVDVSIDPEEAYEDVAFDLLTDGIASVNPETATPGGEIEVSGIAAGSTSVRAMTGNDIRAKLRVMAFRPMPKTVSVRVVHEKQVDGNDTGYSTTFAMTKATVEAILKKVFRQAVVEFDVTVLDPISVNFDINPQDGRVDNDGGWVDVPGSELATIATAAESDFDYNIFLVGRPKKTTMAGRSYYGSKYAFVFYNQPTTLAHEVGHQLDLYDRLSDPGNIMSYNLTAWRLRYDQWEDINNDTTNPPVPEE